MFYVVFTEYDRVKNHSGAYTTPAPVCRYVGSSKSDALEVFKDHVDFAFSTSSPYPGCTYFAGFSADLDFIKEFNQKLTEKGSYIPQEDVTAKDIYLFKNKLNMAACSHMLKHSCYRFTKALIITECNQCNTEATLYKNAYGHYLCTSCWHRYLATENGQVEYVIGLAFGEYKITAFSEKDRALIVKAWNSYKGQLGKTADEILLIENAAKEAGLNFELPEE